jgi:hypothetical protein
MRYKRCLVNKVHLKATGNITPLAAGTSITQKPLNLIWHNRSQAPLATAVRRVVPGGQSANTKLCLHVSSK